jgi:hypothetical protein
MEHVVYLLLGLSRATRLPLDRRYGHPGSGSAETRRLLSPALYVVAIPLTLVNTWLAVALYALLAMIWLVPDRRIERRLEVEAGPSGAQPNGS